MGGSTASTWSVVINKSVISANIGVSNGCGRLGPLPCLLTASLILPSLGQGTENKGAFDGALGPAVPAPRLPPRPVAGEREAAPLRSAPEHEPSPARGEAANKVKVHSSPVSICECAVKVLRVQVWSWRKAI